MGDKFKQAHDFRSRAERLRAIARDLVQQNERQLLEQLADEYDQMARSAAAIAKVEVAQAVGDDLEKSR
jgi:hypothetical protein